MSHLDAVLDRIDADLDQSLDRLFAFLRIPLHFHGQRLCGGVPARG